MSDFEIIDVPTREPKRPRYVDQVAEVDESGKAGVLTVPTEDVRKHVRYIHDSAKWIQRSARIRKTEDEGNSGFTRIVFTVGERILRPRKG